MKVTYPLTSFAAGEISPRLDFRIDIAKYRSGAKTIENGIVMPHGGVRKRPGTRFIAEARDSSQSQRLVPFEFNTEQAYMLEFGPSYIRIFKDQGIVTETAKTITGATRASPCVITAASHGFVNGDRVWITGIVGMSQLNNRHFTVANVTANTFELSGVDATTYGTYSVGGSVARIVEVATPYTASEIADLSFAQSADTLFIAHRNHPIAKLTRTSHTAWTLADADIENGPFRDINTDEDLKITIAATGSASITGATKANPVVITTSSAHGFAEGATVLITGVGGMVEINNIKFMVRNPTATTFELYKKDNTPVNGTGYTTYTSGGTATVSTTDWGTFSPGTSVTLTASSALFQSGHVGALWRLWEPGKDTGIAQPVATKKVANNDQYTQDGKVYGVTNLAGTSKWDDEWRYPSHESGIIRVRNTEGSRFFDAVYLHDTSVILEVTAYTSTTSVTARVVRNHVPKSVVDSGTTFWEEGAWNGARGYPGVITFHEQRLFAAGSTSDPQTLWASRTGAFEDFLDGPDDDNALVYAIASDKVDVVLWLTSGKTLLLGTASGEYSVAPTSQNEALTPSNVRVARQTPFGSAPVRPVRIGAAVLFGQRNGKAANDARKVRELAYSFQADSYVAPDLTIISEHITGHGVTEFAYQANPDNIVWAVRSDGQLAAVTYEREQEVVGWHRHILGGTFGNGGDAVVERAATIPGDDGDELWLVVKRTIGGQTRRYIEMLTAGLTESSEKKDAIYLDGALTYSGATTTTVSGLMHLEGETVDALADGAAVRDLVVSGGTVTLPNAASLVHVGLRYTSAIETLDLEAGAQAGAAKSRAKRISQVYLSVYRTLGGRLGEAAGTLDDIIYRTPSDPMGSSPALRTELVEFDFPAGWEREARVRFEHDEPYPFLLRGLAVEVNTSG